MSEQRLNLLRPQEVEYPSQEHRSIKRALRLPADARWTEAHRDAGEQLHFWRPGDDAIQRDMGDPSWGEQHHRQRKPSRLWLRRKQRRNKEQNQWNEEVVREHAMQRMGKEEIQHDVGIEQRAAQSCDEEQRQRGLFAEQQHDDCAEQHGEQEMDDDEGHAVQALEVNLKLWNH